MSTKCVYMTENSNMVEMVLQCMPCWLDIVWIGSFTIWGHKGCAWEWRNSGRFYNKLLWIQTRLLGCCCCCDCFHSFPFCLLICLLNQGIQLPNKMMKMSLFSPNNKFQFHNWEQTQAILVLFIEWWFGFNLFLFFENIPLI